MPRKRPYGPGLMHGYCGAACGKTRCQVEQDRGRHAEGRDADAILHKGVLFSNSLSVPMGNLTLHFVVRDNVSGRIGSVVVPYAAR
jgi:hypothetical protein